MIGFVLEEARPRPLDPRLRPERRLRAQLLEILEDLGRIEDLEIAMDQHRHLALRINAYDLGVLGLVETLHVERDHHELEVEPLLMRRDLGLGAEHAQGS